MAISSKSYQIITYSSSITGTLKQGVQCLSRILRTTEKNHWRTFGFYIVIFEHIFIHCHIFEHILEHFGVLLLLLNLDIFFMVNFPVLEFQWNGRYYLYQKLTLLRISIFVGWSRLNLDTVTHSPNKMQKMHQDTPHEFCWHQHFSPYIDNCCCIRK